MIYFAVHSPKMFTVEQGSADSSACLDQCIAFLRDAVRNGVCLVDDNGTIVSAIAAAIAQWPERYQKKGQALLERLWADNRILEAPAGDGHDEAADVCRIAEALMRSQKHDFLVVPSMCCCKDGQSLCQAPGGIPISEYSLSFPEELQKSSRIFGPGENGRFEREVLLPMFRSAKWVRVVDKLIGSKASDSNRGVDVPENFRRGLTWLTKRLAKHSDKRRFRELTIVTEYPKNCDSARRRLLEHLYDGFAQELREDRAFTVRVKMVDHDRLPHDRYLLTDQVVLGIGQGFDLLDPSGQLRSLSVSLVSSGEFSTLTRISPIP